MECSCERKQVTRMNLMMCRWETWQELNTKQKPEKPKVITEIRHKKPTDVTAKRNGESFGFFLVLERGMSSSTALELSPDSG